MLHNCKYRQKQRTNMDIKRSGSKSVKRLHHRWHVHLFKLFDVDMSIILHSNKYIHILSYVFSVSMQSVFMKGASHSKQFA